MSMLTGFCSDAMMSCQLYQGIFNTGTSIAQESSFDYTHGSVQFNLRATSCQDKLCFTLTPSFIKPKNFPSLCDVSQQLLVFGQVQNLPPDSALLRPELLH